MTGELGTWDQQAFLRYRALPTGPQKRALASTLITQNEPLLILLVEQLCGRGRAIPGRRLPAAMRIGGRKGLELIEREDAMQAARVAMGKALDQYDPARCKIAYYVMRKILHELQRQEVFELHCARAPEGKGDLRPPVGFVGMPSSHSDHLEGVERAYLHASGQVGGLVEEEDISPADVREWQRTGDWPVSLDAWREEKARRAAARVYSIPAPVLTGWEAFLQRVRFSVSSRAETFDVWNDYALGCRQRGEVELSRPEFVQKLGNQVREVTLRGRFSNVRGLAGLRLCAK